MRLQHVVSGVRSSPSAVIYHACAGSRTGLHLRGLRVKSHTFLFTLLRISHTFCSIYRHVTGARDRLRALDISSQTRFGSVTAAFSHKRSRVGKKKHTHKKSQSSERRGVFWSFKKIEMYCCQCCCFIWGFYLWLIIVNHRILREKTSREPKFTKSVAPHIDDKGTNDLKFRWTREPCVMTPSSRVNLLQSFDAISSRYLNKK